MINSKHVNHGWNQQSSDWRTINFILSSEDPQVRQASKTFSKTQTTQPGTLEC